MSQFVTKENKLISIYTRADVPWDSTTKNRNTQYISIPRFLWYTLRDLDSLKSFKPNPICFPFPTRRRPRIGPRGISQVHKRVQIHLPEHKHFCLGVIVQIKRELTCGFRLATPFHTFTNLLDYQNCVGSVCLIKWPTRLIVKVRFELKGYSSSFIYPARFIKPVVCPKISHWPEPVGWGFKLYGRLPS